MIKMSREYVFPPNKSVILLATYYSVSARSCIEKGKVIHYYVKFVLTDKNILDEIFQPCTIQQNELVRQLLFDMYLERVLQMKIPCEKLLEYVKKLKVHGMKFYWSHLIRYDQLEKKSLCESEQFNNLLISLGIENPNQELYSDLIDEDGKLVCGRRYSPLYGLCKIPEGFLENGINCDLNLLKKTFDMWIEIGCDPHYKHCSWYTPGGFPSGLLAYVNPIHHNTPESITSTQPYVYLTENDLDDTTEYGINTLNSKRYLADTNKNLSLLKFIRYVRETYAKLGYTESDDEIALEDEDM